MQPIQPTSMPTTPPLTEAATPAPLTTTRGPVESTGDRLVQARLGAYSGLFYALRAKHPPTAAHSLRVAVGCSKWAGWRDMPAAERDLLEVSALLHDVGKIGVPDQILQKPGRLDGHEQSMMEMHSGIATELLRGAGANDVIIQIVEQARLSYQRQPDLIVAARMMAIVDAFDSMTTEQVFRPALSRDRAVAELCSHAGEQFDPALVREFAELVGQPRPDLEAQMANRWLFGLSSDQTAGFNAYGVPVSCGAIQNLLDTVFHRRLLDSLADAAIYLDVGGQILHWNRAAERLSGRRAASLTQRTWAAHLMGLMDEQGSPLEEDRYPLPGMTEGSSQINANLQVKRTDGRVFQVHFTAMPVFSSRKELTGTILLIRDASAQASLEQRVQTLHAISEQDTLTKVANRAALTRQLPKFVQEHIATGQRGSLIICDIDFFKRINDNYGHQAGDEALVIFAEILRDTAREDDLVARFGGEEFVVLCEDCDNPSATSRAEEMRIAVENRPIPSLDGNTMTSSFGVTEIQDGDTAETLLARADRALLMAKEHGRNRVVQLGAGQEAHAPKTPAEQRSTADHQANWLGWFRSTETAMAEREYLAAVPQAVAIQKLKGFIADHRAEVLAADECHVAIRIDGQKTEGIRRRGERPAVILLDVSLQSVQFCMNGRSKSYQDRTKFSVTARPVKPRDRRSAILLGQINQVLHSFQAYLVAQEIDDELRHSIIEPR